jgi:hypothetical protein
MATQPTFTHAELMQLWHAISQAIENTEGEENDPALQTCLAAREKLDAYAARPAEMTPEQRANAQRAYLLETGGWS